MKVNFGSINYLNSDFPYYGCILFWSLLVSLQLFWVVLTTEIKMRGQRSIARKILAEIQDEPETENTYLVSYDFINDKPHHRFWSNLHDIISITGGELTQYSVYYGGLRGAKAVKELAKVYGADVRWFIAIELR